MQDLRGRSLDAISNLATKASQSKSIIEFKNYIHKATNYFNEKKEPVVNRVLGIKEEPTSKKIRE